MKTLPPFQSLWNFIILESDARVLFISWKHKMQRKNKLKTDVMIKNED